MSNEHDMASNTYSPDGKVMQIDYACKAVDNTGTGIGVCCKYVITPNVSSSITPPPPIKKTLRSPFSPLFSGEEKIVWLWGHCTKGTLFMRGVVFQAFKHFNHLPRGDKTLYSFPSV